MKKRFLIALPIAGIAIWLLREEPAQVPAPLPVAAVEALPEPPPHVQDSAPVLDAAEPPASAAVAEGPATAVAARPNDEAPSLPLADAPVPENDPIEPELEQTPEWRLEKTTHIASLLDRQLERLDGAVASAEAAGDVDEARRLRIMAARQRQRLEAIRLEVSQLRTQADDVEISSAP